MKSYINIHTHRPKNEHFELPSLRLGFNFDFGSDDKYYLTRPYSAGIHPWDIDKIDDFELLYNELYKREIVAIGEIGLDYSKGLDKDIQLFVFKEQIAIAKELNLPIIIHCVKAYNEILNTLKNCDITNVNGTAKVIFHSFIGSVKLARQISELGYYLSFSPLSLRSPKTIEALQNMPIDKLFIETDDSDQTIESVYEQIAKHLSINIDDLIGIIYKNYIKLFK